MTASSTQKMQLMYDLSFMSHFHKLMLQISITYENLLITAIKSKDWLLCLQFLMGEMIHILHIKVRFF